MVNGYHEGTHLNQVLADWSEPRATDAQRAKLRDDKLAELDNEIQAYDDENKLVLDQLSRLFDRMIANLTKKPPQPAVDGFSAEEANWASHWVKCSLVDLVALKADIRRIGNIVGPAHDALVLLKDKYQKLKDAGSNPSDIIGPLDRNDTFKARVSGARVIIQMSSDGPNIILDGVDGGETLLDTGIPHPQDFLVLRTHTGASKILVCGVTDFDHPEGIIRLFDMPTPGVTFGQAPPPKQLPVTQPFGSCPCSTLTEHSQLLIRPTSLVNWPGGMAYVWDADANALYAITDTDADGVPDQVDLAHSRVRVPPGLDLSETVSLRTIGDSLLLGWRVGTTVDSGDPTVFELRDKDHDGFFGEVRPTTLSRLIEAAGH